MKINWGTGIVIVSLLFMSFIVTLVVKTYQHKVDLVSEDYYNQELMYQDKIDKMINAKNASDKVSWQMGEKEIIFQFPVDRSESEIRGTIEFFRPSDSGKDLFIPILLNHEYRQYVKKELLLQGLYKVRIDWFVDRKGYYTEEDIYI